MDRPGVESSEATKVLGAFLRDIITANPDRFRIVGPDETASNRLSAVFDRLPSPRRVDDQRLPEVLCRLPRIIPSSPVSKSLEVEPAQLDVGLAVISVAVQRLAQQTFRFLEPVHLDEQRPKVNVAARWQGLTNMEIATRLVISQRTGKPR